MELNPQQSYKSVSEMHDRLTTYRQLEAEVANLRAQLSAAQSLLAMQSEALEEANARLHYFDFKLVPESIRIVEASLSATAETVAAWKAKELTEQTPYAYAGEYSVNDILDMRTEVFRELSGFKTKTTQPDVIYPLYRGEAL